MREGTLQPLASPARAPAASARLLVVLPCLNEARSIGKVLGELRESGLPYETLVVDDGSTDDTYRTARALSPTLRHASNLGIGGAVQSGIRFAFENGYDFCVQLDGDGQHRPDQIESLLDQRRRTGASLVIGSRFLGDSAFRSSFMRRGGIRVIRGVFRLLFGLSVTDPTSGFRLMDRRAMALFSKDYPHDYPEPISAAMALEAGLAVAEAPVRMRAREHGRSSIRGLRSLSYMLRVVGYLALVRLSRHLGGGR